MSLKSLYTNVIFGFIECVLLLLAVQEDEPYLCFGFRSRSVLVPRRGGCPRRVPPGALQGAGLRGELVVHCVLYSSGRCILRVEVKFCFYSSRTS